jgi:hypothetical protein
MELIALAALVVLSIALGLTATRFMLWAVLFFMTQSIHQDDFANVTTSTR